MYSAGESKSASPIFVTSRPVHHISPSFHLSRILEDIGRGEARFATFAKLTTVYSFVIVSPTACEEDFKDKKDHKAS
jgi:hypothetical protein